jgi:NAD-dependent deacetylase
MVRACMPNAAHVAIARRALREGNMTIVTQNVDGLHARAAREAAEGSHPNAALPLEVHGSILRDRCSGCDTRSDPVTVDTTSRETLPRCSQCGALLRPDVVWFGEMLDENVLAAATEAAVAAHVCLVVGTSALVHPAGSLPLLTRARGGIVIEVNPESTPLTAISEISIRGRAAEVVPVILRERSDRRIYSE